MNNSLTGEKILHQYKAIIDNCEYTFNEPEVTGKDLLIKANKLPTECYSVYQKLEGCDFELIKSDQFVDLRNLGIEHFQVKSPVVFHYSVNNDPETTEASNLTPIEILNLAGIDHSENYLVQIQNTGHKIIYAFEPTQKIQMVCPGLHFVSFPWTRLVDIESVGKTCQEVPPAKQYKIKIDREYHILNSPYITGTQLIELGQKQPIQNWDAYKFYSNQAKPKKIGHHEVVDLTEQCLVRFVLQPREQKDGKGFRKDFVLPAEDIQFLDNLKLNWETVSDGGLWLLIHNYPLPSGYTTNAVQIALMISPNYPAVEIDMAYFHPHLQRTTGRSINAVTIQIIDGKSFQRWSRHRQPGEWRPGVDNIQTHLTLVDNWIINELTR